MIPFDRKSYLLSGGFPIISSIRFSFVASAAAAAFSKLRFGPRGRRRTVALFVHHFE